MKSSASSVYWSPFSPSKNGSSVASPLLPIFHSFRECIPEFGVYFCVSHSYCICSWNDIASQRFLENFDFEKEYPATAAYVSAIIVANSRTDLLDLPVDGTKNFWRYLP